MRIDILIQNAPLTVYVPVVTGSVTWETSRSGQPGKLTFSMMADHVLKVEEGNAIRMDLEGKPLFFGFIFERSWGKDGEIKVTAYDQLRYLKNKGSYSYTNTSPEDVIRMIAGDYHLNLGELEETGYIIKSRTEKDKSLFDIILTALDLAMLGTRKLFVLYDDAGKLTLRNMENMKLDLLICDKTAEDYSFSISIDSNTYNQILLYYDNEETNMREKYFVKHSENIQKWGILQKEESIGQGVNGQAIAETYLTVYNKPSKSLSIKGALGDTKVRAGCLIPIILNIKEMQLKKYLLVETVRHSFDEGIHKMDLTLKGADIFG